MNKRRNDRPGEESGGHARPRGAIGCGVKEGAGNQVRRRTVAGNRDAGSAREATH